MKTSDNLEDSEKSSEPFSGSSLPEGVIVFTKKKYIDERGSFQEDLNSIELASLGFRSFIQRNMSISNAGVIRGMHWQIGDDAQSKIITCVQGSVNDVFIDLRKSSSTYGAIYSFKLTAGNPTYIRIPSGFAHGFQALEKDTQFSYYVDKPYSPSSEKCINPLSLELEKYWQQLPVIVSEKDKSAVTYSEYFATLVGDILK